MQTLKRKKMYEAQRDNLTAQSFNMEQVRAFELWCRVGYSYKLRVLLFRRRLPLRHLATR